MLTVNMVSKKYYQTTVVRDLSFSLEPGEIVGLLGANGAGKSTTLNMISGYFPPSSGCITLNGWDVITHPLEYKRSIGYLPEFPPLYQDMTVKEQLRLVCSIRRIIRSEISTEIERVSSLCGIDQVLGRMNRSMSKGFRQRIGLAQALIGNPDLVILDEPTSGLDPQQIIEFRNLITSLEKQQTLIISSHILSEISAVASRVLVLHNGTIAADSRVDHLLNPKTGMNILELRVEGDDKIISPTLENIDGVTAVKCFESAETGCFDYEVHSESGNDIRRTIFHILAERNCAILHMRTKNPTLEDFFIGLTREPGVTG